MKMDFEVPRQLCKTRLSRQSKDHHSLLWCTKPKIFWLQIMRSYHTEKSLILAKKGTEDIALAQQFNQHLIN